MKEKLKGMIIPGILTLIILASMLVSCQPIDKKYEVLKDVKVVITETHGGSTKHRYFKGEFEFKGYICEVASTTCRRCGFSLQEGDTIIADIYYRAFVGNSSIKFTFEELNHQPYIARW